MSTTTTNAALVKPDGPDEVDRTLHFNNNWDNIDSFLTTTGVGATGANNQRVHLRDLAVTPSYTGSSTKATLDLQPTWNTSGAMQGVRIVVTHTAAGATSRAFEIKRGANTIFDVDITTNTAVNGLSVIGSAAGADVTLATIGSDSNIDLTVDLKGTGSWTWTGATDVIIPQGDFSVGSAGLGGVIRTGTVTDYAAYTVGFLADLGGVSTGGLQVMDTSNITHGMTTLVETETIMRLHKLDPSTGGISMDAFSEGDYAIMLYGYVTSDNTTKTTGAYGPVMVSGAKKSGTTAAALGANANIMVVRNDTLARFILDGEGDSHQDVGTAWTNFDAYEDTALLNVLANEVSRPADPIKDEFKGWLTYNRSALEEARLVTFNDDGHHFVNMSKLTMLLVGAMRQQGEKLRALEAQVRPLLTG